MKSNESREMYLETIYKLELQNELVRSIDIAKEMGYSKPSVSRAMGVLKKNGYITHTKYGNITLTTEGRIKAKQIYHTHHLLTNFLVQTLGIDHDLAEADACKIEHVISEETLTAIESYLKSAK